MKLPTIGVVVDAAVRTARRFPLVLVAAIVAAYAAMTIVNGDGEDEPRVRLFFSAMLGLPLGTACALLAERRAVGATQVGRWLIPLAGVAVVVGFWFLWPDWSSSVRTLRYVQITLAFHLLASFLPFVGQGEPNGFWHYNKLLLLRFLTAALYTVVLFAGLALALVALDKLFGISIESQAYARIWIFIALVFNPWFFLAGIPTDLGELEGRTEYPTGLRIFTQYVLVPLVALYLLILSVYLPKVLITRDWPSGWIGYLVSGVAVAGILSWLLVRPLEDRAEFAWVRTFTRGFYLVLMPPIVMLWLAIGLRVQQYGITEPRYFLVVLSVWLAAIACWFTFTRSRNIGVIPVSLCALALLTFAGPTSAYSVSRRSQRTRLTQALQRNRLFDSGGKLQAPAGIVPDSDRVAITAGRTYLLDTHGHETVLPWLSDSLQKKLGSGKGRHHRFEGNGETETILASIKMEPLRSLKNRTAGYFSFSSRVDQPAIAIEGFTHLVQVTGIDRTNSWIVAGPVMVRAGLDSASLELLRDSVVVLRLPLGAVADSVGTAPLDRVPQGAYRIDAVAGEYRARLYVNSVYGFRRAGRAFITGLDGRLLLSLPKQLR